MKVITKKDRQHLQKSIEIYKKAKKVVALTGAGISVESGIDDFRSPGGLWSIYPPDEYATIDVFNKNPEKAWTLFRQLGKGLSGKKPNRAHTVLAELESDGSLQGIVTQNVDNLHQDAGSKTVVEIHGNHHQLQCLGCGELIEIDEDHLKTEHLPRCGLCNQVLKPNVVLFGEAVRCLDDISFLLSGCDLLIVIGTSAQVYPAASLPEQVKRMGGQIFEFNKVKTVLTKGEMYGGVRSDFFFQGSAGTMLTFLLQHLKSDG